MGVLGSGAGANAHPSSLSLQTLKEMDQTLTIRSEGSEWVAGRGAEGSRAELCGAGAGCQKLLHLTVPVAHPHFFFAEPPE